MTFLVVPAAAAGALYVFPSTPMGKMALLEPPSLDELEPDSAHEEHLRSLIGRAGRTVGLLTPGGVVLVDGERHHCESEGMLVESGVDVDVIEVKSNRLVVRVRSETPAEAAEFGQRSTPDEPAEDALGDTPVPLDEPAEEVAGETEPPLDFPISQG